MEDFWDTKIEFLKGIGAQRAKLLNQELNIFTYADLLRYYPFRHEDRTQIHQIADLEPDMTNAQIQGRIVAYETVGEGRGKRLTARFVDGSGDMELVWFQGISWQLKNLKPNIPYLVFGKPQFFNGRYSIVHPEMEVLSSAQQQTGYLQPIYRVSEKLKKRYISAKNFSKFTESLLSVTLPRIEENLPEYLIEKYRLLDRQRALRHIHFPSNQEALRQAKRRLKFEELFFIQLKMLKQRHLKKTTYKGQVFDKKDLLQNFYQNHLPFELTGAQKRVLAEVAQDLESGQQMNRLLQGDVGSGKTMVAFIAMLMAIDSGAQACMVAPTEILAEQHYQGLQPFAEALGLKIDLLTGSTRKKDRRVLHARLENGNLNILIGTHALFEDTVQFDNLGLCIIDEQHRFGVAQRSRLWSKNKEIPPHILVMTATPIPRTLAMTLYGDLDVSIIDEMPMGRKPIKTAHRYEKHRLRVFGFLKEEIRKGRQVYIVYPLVEESEKLDYKNVMEGYESIQRAFPEYHISIVHGQMSSVDKDYEMQRFKRNETQIMVATTVIEVGVNVPNASVMVIENAERFGLSQLHQLRGRVGRGAEQSYCILMSDYKLSKEARIRIDTMVKTNNGFEIADIDMKLRGPGDIMGTQQSGIVDLVIADLAKDANILKEARQSAQELIERDPYLESKEHESMKRYLQQSQKQENYWSRIS